MPVSPNFRVAFAGFACLAALPAHAQDICGGAGNGGQWIGGSEAASDISTAPSFQEQMALVLGSNQHVALFSLSAPASVRIEAEGRGSGDPLIDVFDEGGTILVSDDDSGGNGSARTEIDLGAGTYCVATTSYDGAPMTAFVRIGRTEHEALTAGITDTTSTSATVGTGNCSEAIDIGTFSTALAYEASADEAPFLTFTLAEALAVSVTAVNETADPLITLYDADEAYLDENDDYDGLNSRIDMTDPLPAGTYCIGVEALSDTGAPILVEVTEYDPEAALASLVDQGEAAPSFDGSIEITDLGGLDNRMRRDAQASDVATWFSVDMPESGVVLIEAISPTGSGDPWLVMFDDLGRLVSQNDDHGDGFDSLLAARVNRGTYLIGLRDISGTPGLTRMVLERFVPAP